MKVYDGLHSLTALPSILSVQEAVWAPKSFWTVVGEEESLLPLPGIEPGFLGHPSRNLVTKPTPVGLCDKNWLHFA